MSSPAMIFDIQFDLFRVVDLRKMLMTFKLSLAGGVPACVVPQDGCALLHCQGEGQTWPTGAQKDLHLCGFHTNQPVSHPWQLFEGHL